MIGLLGEGSFVTRSGAGENTHARRRAANASAVHEAVRSARDCGLSELTPGISRDTLLVYRASAEEVLARYAERPDGLNSAAARLQADRIDLIDRALQASP
jgi:hypothetical protein